MDTQPRRWLAERLTAFERTQAHFRLLAYCVRATFGVSLVMFFAIGFWADVTGNRVKLDVLWMWLSIGIMAVSTFLHPSFTHRQLSAKAAVTQIRNRMEAVSDHRSFFLLLRSLTQATHQTEMDLLWYDEGVGGPAYVSRNLVHSVASALGDHGKLVIVGGEPSPTVHLDNDPPELSKNVIWVECDANSWRRLVEGLLPLCRAAVVIPETTDGLRHELRVLQEQNCFPRTVIVMAAIGRGIVPHSRVSRWQEIVEALKRDGFSLPPYDRQGWLYIPNEDLSVNLGRPLGGNSVDDFRRAIDDLLPRLPPRTSIREIMAEIKGVEDGLFIG